MSQKAKNTIKTLNALIGSLNYEWNQHQNDYAIQLFNELCRCRIDENLKLELKTRLQAVLR